MLELELQTKNVMEIVLISKKQHWRSPAKKLDEQSKADLQGCQGKTEGKEKRKLI